MHDVPDGILEDAFGNILFDGANEIVNEDIGVDMEPSYPYKIRSGHPLFGSFSFEAGYDPINNPDPAGDDFHPIFNPTGTEGNGRLDPNEDLNANGKLDTIEYGLQKWLKQKRKD